MKFPGLWGLAVGEIKRVFLNFFLKKKASLSLVEVNFWQDNDSVCGRLVIGNMELSL